MNLPIEKWRKISLLLSQTGCVVEQKNGERTFGYMISNTERPKGSEIFIGKIPRDCFEDELIPILMTVPGFNRLRLMMTFSGNHRGFGFAEFIDPELAKNAVSILNNLEIREGYFLGVSISTDNRRLVISGITPTKTATEIASMLNNVVKGLIHVRCRNENNYSFALVEFMSHTDASQARRVLVPYCVQIFGNREVAVDWANTNY